MQKHDFETSAERDAYILEHADYFTVVRFLGYGQYERHERKTLKGAEKLASRLAKARKSGNKYMIYAVAGQSDAFIKAV